MWSLFSTNNLCCETISLLVVTTRDPQEQGVSINFPSIPVLSPRLSFPDCLTFPMSKWEEEEESFDMRIVQLGCDLFFFDAIIHHKSTSACRDSLVTTPQISLLTAEERSELPKHEIRLLPYIYMYVYIYMFIHSKRVLAYPTCVM